MGRMVTVAVDAMGGDNAPQVVLEGCKAALAENPNLTILLCGLPDVVEPFAAAHDRCEAICCSEVIAMDDHPVSAVRAKKDSSMVVGAKLVAEGRAQGFFSAGSTGATLAVGTLIMGRIKGVQRPALCSILPAPSKPVVMCDVGANADCKPQYLVQFGKMASIYVERAFGAKNPKAYLLNIGEEDVKGSSFAVECNSLLRQGLPNFAGNCEGRDLLTGMADVVITDGFTGNVCLKCIEGTASVMFGELKKSFMSSLKTKLAALALKPALGSLKRSLSADTYGAAPILGVKGACMVGHGSSSAKAITSGIRMTVDTIESGITEAIAEAMAVKKE